MTIISPVAPNTLAASQIKSAPKNVGGGFKGVLESIRGQETPSNRIQIEQIEKDIFSGKGISSRELLLYQVKVGQFGLKVEMASKLAEGVSSTLKRLQGG